MKKILSVLALAALSLNLNNANAGEEYCPAPSGKECAPASHDCCPCGNFYVFGFGGASFSPELNGTVVQPGFGLDFDLDTGWVVGGGAGIRTDFLGGFRFEVEGLYGENDFDTNGAIFNGTSFPGTTGSIERAAVHVNFIKEFRGLGALLPYVGGGIGYTDITANNVQYGALPVVVDDSDGAFSWQLIGGLEYALSDRLGIYVEYTYSEVGDLELNRIAAVPTTFAIDDISNHSVRGGLRFTF